MQRKGLRTLIRAARRVLEEVPSAEFWIVGEDAAQAELKQACRAADVDRQFRFMGWKRHAEMTDLYRQASVFVMPSLEEAFGVVFLEAMASGVPVIGTRVGGIPELINDGENGLLVNPDDPQDLSQALLMLLESCALQEQLGEAGKRRAQQFDVDRMMRCTYEVYEDVLS
jgi:glycosyltransferase involved in cell wall biosynthesis